jgi:hypothetical protein
MYCSHRRILASSSALIIEPPFISAVSASGPVHNAEGGFLFADEIYFISHPPKPLKKLRFTPVGLDFSTHLC